MTCGDIDGLARAAGSGASFNLIPSDNPGDCKTILVAVAKRSARGGQGVKALGPTLTEVFRILEEVCPDVTRVVVLVTPTWDWNKVAQAYVPRLATHARRGVRFLVLHAGAAPLGLSPILLDLR